MYDDVQLSTILGEHAAGHLRRNGGHKYWCIEQVAMNSCNVLERAYRRKCMDWFDKNYQSSWSPEKLLHAMAKQGLVEGVHQ